MPMTALKTQRFLASLAGAAGTAVAQAEAELAPLIKRAEEPQTGTLAVVGLGLLVLSAIARRRNDP